MQQNICMIRERETDRQTDTQKALTRAKGTMERELAIPGL